MTALLFLSCLANAIFIALLFHMRYSLNEIIQNQEKIIIDLLKEI